MWVALSVPVVDGTGYRKVTLSGGVSNGTFSAADVFSVFFTRAGDKGIDGAGAGDVIGPASATDDAIVRYDGTTGKLVKDSVVTVANTTGLIAGSRFANAGLKLEDTDASHLLTITPGSNLSANRVLTVTTGDAARTLDISAGSVTISTAGAALIDDAAASNQRTTLGLVIGTDVQAAHAYLSDIAAITANQGDIIYFNGTDWVDLAPGTSGQFLKTLGAAANPIWDTPSGGAAATTTSAGIVELATAAEYRTGTDTGRVPAIDQIWASLAEVTLTDNTTVTISLADGIDFVVTLGGNRTLDNPSNVKVGQRGRIRIVQDGTGTRTLAFASNWEFIGAQAPVLSTTAADQDILYYDCISATRILAWLARDIS